MTPDDQPRRILIVKLGAIGDVVNTLPLLNALRDAFPTAHIAWAIEKKSLSIVEGHRALSEIIVFPRETWMRDLAGFLRRLRAGRFDWVLDLQRILKTGFIMSFSGGRLKLAFDRPRSKELSWLFPARRIPRNASAGLMLEQYLEFARALGVPLAGPVRWDVPVGQEDERRAEELLAPAGARPVVLNLGASKPENLWPPERWAALADALARKLGTGIVLTGGPVDRAAASEVVSRAGGPPLDLVGRMSIGELACVLARAAFVVSSDTGPLHLAVAMGTPVVGLYGPADPRRTGPYGYLDLVVQPPGGLGRMDGIEVDAVLSMILRNEGRLRRG